MNSEYIPIRLVVCFIESKIMLSKDDKIAEQDNQYVEM